MQVIIDTEEVKKLINSEAFINFLMVHADISTSAFILQAIKDKLKELKSE